MELDFAHRFVNALPQDPNPANRCRQVHGALWSAVTPEPVAAPRLVAASADMLQTLGLDAAVARTPAFAEVFGGNRLLPGMRPHASNYGGHQFGSWAGQLGDGRAITLGEVRGTDGQYWALQLKGAGPTPYSRRGDGRAVLRSSLREFLCSEAMHHLGIPTTRALALVATGEAVVRDRFYDGHPRAEPGAIVCRAAPSFLRFGHVELPAARGETALMRQVVEFCIEQDFPHLAGQRDRHATWFREVAGRTAQLIAEWMRVGFVHGVMNTDNLSLAGLTLDYGPYGWLDAYDPGFTPNTSDRDGRYRFGYQPRVALWNLQQLAVAIAPLFADPTAPLQAGLAHYGECYARAERDNACRKLGLPPTSPDALPLLRRLHAWLHAAEVDMTLFFLALGDNPADALCAEHFAASHYCEEKRRQHAATLDTWLADYRRALAHSGQSEAQRAATCRAANPRFILRNGLVQTAIEQAEAGDERFIHTLLARLRTPYQPHPDDARLVARSPDAARLHAALSCSS